MPILYDKTNRIFKIDAKDFSYIFMIDSHRALIHLYFGKKIAANSGLKSMFHPRQRAFAPVPADSVGNEIDGTDTLTAEFSANGRGDYHAPSAVVRTPDGFEAVTALYQSHRILDGKPELPGLPATFAGKHRAETLEITLTDPATGIEYILLYSVFDDVSAIVRSMRIVNRSKTAVTVEKAASATWCFEETGFDLVSLPGAWGRERTVQRLPLGQGMVRLASSRGLSSHQMNPACALTTPEATEESGEAYGFALLYSGNFEAVIERDQFDQVRCGFGINPETFAWHLAPGETFQTPEAAAVYSDAGLGGMSREFHDLWREHLIRSQWLNRPRPVLVNSWEAAYFDFDTDRLLEFAKTSAKLGIDMLVLDDGWFGERDNDQTSLGDWVVNEKKLPGGLKRLSDEIHRLGMTFGLWFEPEMISPESKLYTAHPDWCLHIPGRDGSLGRHQLVLDMSRDDVVDYLYRTITAILDSTAIEYIKWDANRHLTEVGSALLPPERQREVSHRFMLGTYKLHEMLLRHQPDLLIEGCSGGGGRFDAGMLFYAPQIWCSDNTDCVERLATQMGTSLFYPCSAMGAHVSACPNHMTRRTTPFDTRAIVASSGSFGYELAPDKLSPEERAALPEQICRFRRINPVVAKGDLYRLMPPGGRRCAWMSVSKDQSECVVTVVAPQVHVNGKCDRLRLRGLASGKFYTMEDGTGFYGDFLMNYGIYLAPAQNDAEAMLYHFVAK